MSMKYSAVNNRYFLSFIKNQNNYLISYPYLYKKFAYADIVSNIRAYESADKLSILIESPFNRFFINHLLEKSVIWDDIFENILEIKQKLLRFVDFDHEYIMKSMIQYFLLCINKDNGSISFMANDNLYNDISDSFICSFDEGNNNYLSLLPFKIHSVISEYEYRNMLNMPYKHILYASCNGEYTWSSRQEISGIFLSDILKRPEDNNYDEIFFSNISLYQKIRIINSMK